MPNPFCARVFEATRPLTKPFLHETKRRICHYEVVSLSRFKYQQPPTLSTVPYIMLERCCLIIVHQSKRTRSKYYQDPSSTTTSFFYRLLISYQYPPQLQPQNALPITRPPRTERRRSRPPLQTPRHLPQHRTLQRRGLHATSWPIARLSQQRAGLHQGRLLPRQRRYQLGRLALCNDIIRCFHG